MEKLTIENETNYLFSTTISNFCVNSWFKNKHYPQKEKICRIFSFSPESKISQSGEMISDILIKQRYNLVNKSDIVDYLKTNRDCISVLAKIPTFLHELFTKSELNISLESDYYTGREYLQLSLVTSGNPKKIFENIRKFNKTYWFKQDPSIRNRIIILPSINNKK